MRLVSAYYEDYGPFYNLKNLTSEGIWTNDPNDLRQGDILIVWGGGDIHPSLYNKGRSSMSGASHTPNQRDRIEWELMNAAQVMGIPIIGVCRGGQMLTALAGGYLIQHIEGHAGYRHNIQTNDNQIIRVNSIHHQMMVPDGTKHELVAWSEEKRSNLYYDEDNLVNMEIEPEFIYYPELQGFAVQWHPEMMADDDPANLYLNQFIEERL